MKRSRKFSHFILVLLIINSLFFIAWYGLNLKGVVKNIAEREIGKALNGKASIEKLSLGERQIVVENFAFASNDSLLKMHVDELRLRYNLLKVIFGGFKLKDALQNVEISRPRVALMIRPGPPKPKKPSKAFEIPDLMPYFGDISIVDGSLTADITIDLKLLNPGPLRIKESLEEINISAVNDKLTKLSLRAKAAKSGSIKLDAKLHKGLVTEATAEISSYNPQSIYHPDIRDFSTELNLVASASQNHKKSPFDVDIDLILWDTRAMLANKYPLSLPYLHAKGNQDEIDAEISKLRLAGALLNGELEISNLPYDYGYDATFDVENIDLALLEQGLTGRVSARIEGSGSLKEPYLQAQITSSRISYSGFTLSNISLGADYADDIATATLTSARWQNQDLRAQARLNTDNLLIRGELSSFTMSRDSLDLAANGKLSFSGDLSTGLPTAQIEFENIDFSYQDLSLWDINGSLELQPLIITPQERSYFVSASVNGAQGFELNLIGDILKEDFYAKLALANLELAKLYDHNSLKTILPILSGNTTLFLANREILAQGQLNVDLSGSFHYNSDLDLIGSYNLNNQSAKLDMIGSDGMFNEEPVDLQLSAQMKDHILDVFALQINHLFSLSGSMNLQDLADTRFDLALMNLDKDRLRRIYPALGELLPDFGGLNLKASYDWDLPGQIEGQLNLAYLEMEGMVPLSADINVIGPPEAGIISGSIRSRNTPLAHLYADFNLGEQTALDARLRFSELQIADLMDLEGLRASLSGSIGASYQDLFANISRPEINVDARVRQLKIPGFDIDSIDLVAAQKTEMLIVDALSVYKEGLLSLTGSGALDYNLLDNRYYEGSNKLNIQGSGQLFSWLKDNVGYILDAQGNTELNLELGVEEEQFFVSSGTLSITDGSLRLKDQTETINSITLSANIQENKVYIDNLSATMGGGQLKARNFFSRDESNHFQVAMLDLGILQVKIDDPGIQMNIPMFTAPRSLSRLSLHGQGADYATVMGPFDDMKIKARANISRAAAVYPPNTDNLLKLIYTVRDAAFSRETIDPLPMPFTLDLILTIQDNVSYVTFPTNVVVDPGSYMHLMYDGLQFSLSEANFTSERGSIDFFGTVFQVDELSINIMESQNLLDIKGDFVRRAPDGTLITLSVTTDRDVSKDLFDRLQFNLTSDNPQDVTTTDVLARLRYNRPEDELSTSQRQNLLGDEAINLITGNINSSLISPFLYPLENKIRRFFKLDAFSINVGFIQNLVTEYSNNQEQLAEYTDFKQITSDVVQFSSSILLNNFSLSASKYLIGKLFLDYRLTLQEATDLQKNTLLLVSHDTSLRMMLPWRLKLSYNLIYEATERDLSHQIMLQRSFRFRGL